MNKRVEFDHKNSKGKHREVLTLALLVAVLPLTWAVVSPYLGVHVGPIALITAGMLTMNLDPTTSLSRLFLEIAAAMLVGVYYVGALIDKLHSLIN